MNQHYHLQELEPIDCFGRPHSEPTSEQRYRTLHLNLLGLGLRSYVCIPDIRICGIIYMRMHDLKHRRRVRTKLDQTLRMIRVTSKIIFLVKHFSTPPPLIRYGMHYTPMKKTLPSAAFQTSQDTQAQRSNTKFVIPRG